MEKNSLAKLLAFSGTALVAFPVLAPAAFGLIQFAQAGRFLFDYLMPAELFPAVLVGGILLLAAACLSRSHRRLIGGTLGLAVFFLVGSQVLAVVTGLASGAAEPAGLPWAMVMIGIAGYWISLLALIAAGVLLLRKLYGGSPSP